MHAGCSYFCSHIRKIITSCILFQLYSYLIFWKYWLNCRQMKEREHCLGTHLSMFSILCRMETRPSERIVLRRCQLFFLFFGVIACISIVCTFTEIPPVIYKWFDLVCGHIVKYSYLRPFLFTIISIMIFLVQEVRKCMYCFSGFFYRSILVTWVIWILFEVWRLFGFKASDCLVFLYALVRNSSLNPGSLFCYVTIYALCCKS